MGGLDKIRVPLAGRPLLAWTLERLAAAPEVARIVVVTAPSRVAEVTAAPWLPAAVVAVVAGADRRQGSVAAGVRRLLELDGLDVDLGRTILIHDGARPAVEPALVSRVCAAVARYGAAIPAIPVADTVKRVAGGRIVETLDRTALVVAQTPQGTRLGTLLEAWDRFPPDGPPEFTDEAALLEACRILVHVLPGDPANLKVTVPADLLHAESALGSASDVATPSSGMTHRPVRAGSGRDAHPFGPGEPLVLGGVAIPGAPRLYGHSDGDAALHAVADALLGAAGLGDLGRQFPADASTPAGVASGELLVAVIARLAGAGLRPSSIDLTIIGARPRLGPWLDPMRDAIAALVGLPAGRVSVKASSGNLTDWAGAGRGIAAEAIALVEAFDPATVASSDPPTVG